MDEREDKYSQDSRCCYSKCEACLLFSHCETCYDELCLFEQCNQFCGRCPVTCHSKPDPIFEETDLSKLHVSNTANFEAQCAWFPTIRQNRLLKKLKLEIVAVKFEEVYNFRSGLMRALDLKDYFYLHPKTKIILTFNVPDPILEKIWLTFLDRTFKLVIKGLKVDYICTPNFSNFFDTPRYQYWRNIWRAVEITNLLSDLGYNVIFDVSSPVPATHTFYMRLIKTSNVQSIIFNCQTLKLSRYKQLAYERFKVLNDLPIKIPFLINGLTSEKESKPIYEALRSRRIYFTSSSPYLRAVCKYDLNRHIALKENPLRLLKSYFLKMDALHQCLRYESTVSSKKS